MGKVSGETMTSLHTHTQVVTMTEVEYLIPSMIVAYDHVSPMHGDQEQYWGRRAVSRCRSGGVTLVWGVTCVLWAGRCYRVM